MNKVNSPKASVAEKAKEEDVAVLDETQRHHNHVMNMFLCVNINEKPKNALTTELEMGVLWERYCEWCEMRRVLPKMEDLQEEMELRYGAMIESNGFRGWQKISLWKEFVRWPLY